jgi:hypothetical protein
MKFALLDPAISASGTRIVLVLYLTLCQQLHRRPQSSYTLIPGRLLSFSCSAAGANEACMRLLQATAFVVIVQL